MPLLISYHQKLMIEIPAAQPSPNIPTSPSPVLHSVGIRLYAMRLDCGSALSERRRLLSAGSAEMFPSEFLGKKSVPLLSKETPFRIMRFTEFLHRTAQKLMRNNFSEEGIALRSLSAMLLLRNFGVLREPNEFPRKISAHALADFTKE